MLKDKGILVVTVPNGYGLYSLIYDHFRNKVLARIISEKVGPSLHLQTFSLGRIKKSIEEAGFEVLKIGNSDFVSFLPLLVKINGSCYWDCKLADRLPSQLVSGWFLLCQKKRM